MPRTKEYEYDSIGNKILRKEIISEGRYDKVDLILRIIASSAVIVTIIGLSCNINAQRKQQKILFQLDVYESALPIINKLCFNSAGDSNYTLARNQFSYEIMPRIKLTDNADIIQVIEQFDTLLALKEHCAGLLDSFRLASRAFFVFERNYSSNHIKREDSVFYKNFDHYWVWFNQRKRLWEDHQNLYVRAMKIAFSDSSERKVQQVSGFYQRLDSILNDYSDLYLYNLSNLPPLNDSSVLLTLEEYKSVLKSRNILKPATLLFTFKTHYKNIDKLDSSFLDKTRDLQNRILNEMTKSNK